MKYGVGFLRKVTGWGLALALIGVLPAQAAAPILTLTPATVKIGTFFTGDEVSVLGAIPAGTEAVLEVVGSSAEETLMRKGRRGGLWMNVGKIMVQDAPSLYLVLSTAKPLLTSPPPDASWGYGALEKRLSFSGSIEPSERQEFLKQFLQLKEEEHFYASLPGALKVEPASGRETPVKGSFLLPTITKPGTYKVTLSVIQAGKVVSSTSADLKVEMVGFPAVLASLAYQHGATYGVLAVVIAIVTGFAMGFIFKGGGGH
ncbi:MAG TPA: TIGR02186 family protein [Desulfobaccales bacterium]|nr:TIGR02186 family protein [Desulfobaccales bacterium]